MDFMNKLFSSKERIKILKAIVFSNAPKRVNTIADSLKLSKGLVSKYFDVLVKKGVAKRVGSKYVIIESALTKGIKVLLNIGEINIAIFKKYNFIKSVGIYGSCAKGENTEESDVDLWIKTTDVSDEDLAPLTAKLNKKINTVKPLFLTENTLIKMKKSDELFYHSLAFGSIVIYGDKNGIQL